jgi:hypothetical protein
MIRTDVVGFENFLQSNKERIDPELLAAKMCGRWRNGVPLALSPETDKPPGGLSQHAGAVIFGLGQQLDAMALECRDDLCPHLPADMPVAALFGNGLLATELEAVHGSLRDAGGPRRSALLAVACLLRCFAQSAQSFARFPR